MQDRFFAVGGSKFVGGNRHHDAIARASAGAKVAGVKCLATAVEAEKAARRLGAGARIYRLTVDNSLGRIVLVATIARKSAHLDGLVTEVTLEGGAWL